MSWTTRYNAKQMGLLVATCAALAGTSPGCAKKAEVAPVSAHDEAIQQGAYVPMAAEVDARLLTGISTDASNAGQTFSATVLQPLRMVNGGILVRAGDTLTGRVVDLDRSAMTPSLRLRFEQITTTVGVVPLHATLGQAQHGALADMSIFGPGQNFDALIRGNPPRAPTAPIGGGPAPTSEPSSVSRAPSSPRSAAPSTGTAETPEACPEPNAEVPPAPAANAIRMPAGTEFAVVLTERLVKPAPQAKTSPPQ